MPNSNLKILMETNSSRANGIRFACSDFTELYQKITDTAKELFTAVPVMTKPRTSAERRELTTKMAQAYRDTTELRSALSFAIGELNNMLGYIHGDSKLLTFMEEPDTSKCFWATSWIFPIADDVFEAIVACKNKVFKHSDDVECAAYFLNCALGFEDLEEGLEFFPPHFGENEDNRELRECKREELLTLCNEQCSAIQKMFELAAEARNAAL